MLTVIEEIRERTAMPYQAILSAVGISYPSFIRWRLRSKQRRASRAAAGPSQGQAAGL